MRADQLGQTQQQTPDGRWIEAEPLVGPFLWRLRQAWDVLIGRAHALYWPRETKP